MMQKTNLLDCFLKYMTQFQQVDRTDIIVINFNIGSVNVLICQKVT